LRVKSVAIAAALTMAAMSETAFLQQKGAPETFTANLQATGGTSAGGAGAATIQVNVQRYTPEGDRTAVATALKSGGTQAFLAALKKAPEVGTVTFGDKKWPIRWAREQTTPKGRNITVVTDQPIYFVGGGSVDAKPRAGYDVAVIQMFVDDVGLGNGTMAAAAKVKPGGESGVEIEDYAAKPIKMVSVVRKF
jgi:hypothetical protein